MSIAGPAWAPKGGVADDRLEAARGLEAFFVRRVLAEVRTLGRSMGGSVAGDTFGDMLVEALADAIAASDRLGMTRTLAAQMFPAGQGTAEGIVRAIATPAAVAAREAAQPTDSSEILELVRNPGLGIRERDARAPVEPAPTLKLSSPRSKRSPEAP